MKSMSVNDSGFGKCECGAFFTPEYSSGDVEGKPTQLVCRICGKVKAGRSQ